MSSLIQINNLSKSFDGIKKTKVLKKISYNFKKGKIVDDIYLVKKKCKKNLL